jgi:hypothetical protein
MAGKGGATVGAGRKSVAEEQKSNAIFISAIKQVNNIETDEEARIELAKDLLTFERGKMFIAEHIFGKPKETVETTHNINDFNIKDIFKIGNKS